jgi:hypothetical protein
MEPKTTKPEANNHKQTMKTTIRCRILLAVLGLIAAQPAVKADTIINNFNNGFDYQANGVPGTMWDGVYLGFGDVFGGSDGGDIALGAISASPYTPMKPPIRVS